MRNHFTITISDVHGARHYSFKQFVRKFVWILFAVFVTVWTVGGISIWWLYHEADNVELAYKNSVKAFTESLETTRSDYESLLIEKTKLEQDLLSTSSQVAFLDQALQGLEELVGEGDSASEIDVPPLPLDERVKRVQLNSLGKNIMMSMVPSGPAVANYKGLSSKYGRRIHPITGKKHLHGGLDYRGKTGATVIATADGVVKYSSRNKESGFGNLVTLVHANGFMTRYAHLSKRTVRVGDYVQKGEKIGEIGNTGRSTGSHLHYEVWFLYKRLNPQAFNDWSVGKYDEIFTKVKGVPWGSLSQAVDMHVKKVEKQLLLKGASLAVKLPI
ncbi:MAG: M23 family metallopeptidase [Thiomicrorhabdus sp.]|jgi:murein DD-endopeptidase MepM/ murein hydrolase activator NlpD|nr:M23 family metallopeptidase [Thiomicrorhabdus sp.]